MGSPDWPSLLNRKVILKIHIQYSPTCTRIGALCAVEIAQRTLKITSCRQLNLLFYFSFDETGVFLPQCENIFNGPELS